MISLGCPKNQVDAEQMLGVLSGSGFEVTSDQTEADVIVVNTCGFIESAKDESIEAILDAAKMKKGGKCRALIVAGCLAQRYSDELRKELPEADAIIGTAEISRIGEICDRALGGGTPVTQVSAPEACLRPSAGEHDAAPLSVSQDRRRLQQPLLLLRHSDHPGELRKPAFRIDHR